MKPTTAAQAERFEQLALPHLALLLRTAQYLARHTQAAEDLVQETMIKALRNMDSFHEGTDIKAWLLTILRHTHIDLIRQQTRRAGTVSMESLEQEPAATTAQTGAHDAQWNSPAAMMEQFADRDVIAALKALPMEMRWCLLLVDVEQLELTQAATILEVPIGTVKSRLHRGRALLRDRLLEWAHKQGWAGIQESRHARQDQP